MHSQGHILALLLCFSCIILGSCEDVFEKDISKEDVVLKSPSDSVVLDQGNIQFWWEHVDGALEYRIQVVRNSFDEPEELIIDSLSPTNIYHVLMYSGTYQWRIHAQNGSSSTLSETRVLVIDSSTSLDNGTVILSYPYNGLCTNDDEVLFGWQSLGSIADAYEFEIRRGDFASSEDIIYNEKIYEEFDIGIDFGTVPDGDYSWAVRASNDFSVSPWTIRSFHLDRTAPGMPQLVSPGQSEVVTSDSISFAWTRNAQVSDCDALDTLIILSDSLAQNPLVKVGSTTKNYTWVDESTGEFFWYVRSYDGAGNASGDSELRKVIRE